MSYLKYDVTKQDIPAVNKIFKQKNGTFAYDRKDVIESHKKMINDVEKNYGNLISKWAKVFDIDEGVIISFICTESGGKNVQPNSFKATGLMQVTPLTVYETITKWKTMVGSDMPQQAVSFFNSKVSSTSKWSGNRQPSSSELSQITTKLNDVEYNIAVGTAVIRWLLQAYNKIGKATLEKVIVSYNAGFYGTRNLVKDQNITEILANNKLQAETKNYVLKMLGVFGFMDLYYNIMNK
jgi:hypothetical protein